MTIGSFIKAVRNEMGYASARSFYDFLSEQLEPSFNYSYYTRIESGSVSPSKSIIEELAGCLSKKEGEGLVLLWCSLQFPSYKKLFAVEKPKSSREQSQTKDLQTKQKVLTENQVAMIARSKLHYQVFLVLTLSRKSIAQLDLIELFDEPIYSTLKDLQEVKVIVQDGNFFRQSAVEMRFPKAETQSLKEAFKNVESWNKELKGQMNFKPVKDKFFIRRTSSRHFDLLIGFLDHMDNLVRVSDDIDVDLNDEVFVFEYSLSQGKMPG